MIRSDKEASGNEGKGVTRNMAQNKRTSSSGRSEAEMSEGSGATTITKAETDEQSDTRLAEKRERG